MEDARVKVINLWVAGLGVAGLGVSDAFPGPNSRKLGNIGGLIILKDLASEFQRVYHSGLAEPPFSGSSIKNNTFFAYARTRP